MGLAFDCMKTSWPMRRPLFPVAIAGLVGTVVGLIIAPHPLVGLGFAFSFGILSWWGPKKR